MRGYNGTSDWPRPFNKVHQHIKRFAKDRSFTVPLRFVLIVDSKVMLLRDLAACQYLSQEPSELVHGIARTLNMT